MLYRILDGTGRTLDVHRQSTPTDELLDRLRAYDGQGYVGDQEADYFDDRIVRRD